MRPIVQISLDVVTIEEALATAEMALRAGVDWLEAGTPLIIAEGMNGVRALRERFPQTPIVADLKTIEPRLMTSILFGAVNLDPVGLAQAIHADYVHPCWERRAPQPHTLLTPEWVARVHGAGLGIVCWHEERPDEIAALRALGVDAICSDTPDRLAVHRTGCP